MPTPARIAVVSLFVDMVAAFCAAASVFDAFTPPAIPESPFPDAPAPPNIPDRLIRERAALVFAAAATIRFNSVRSFARFDCAEEISASKIIRSAC